MQRGPRSSNNRCSHPSIWISSPADSRRWRGWWTTCVHALRSPEIRLPKAAGSCRLVLAPTTPGHGVIPRWDSDAERTS